MYRIILVFALILITDYLPAQTPRPTLEEDTIRLNEVVVTGFASNRRLLETAAPVSLLTRRDLQQRFGTPTLVPALNTLPGVRIDERSPGSYRLSIRGSLIRSPFGVRNVKVYYNELPLTDAAGNTALNALDVRSIGRVEVIKGPSGSLYGAGTGGTVLFSGLAVPAGQSTAEVSALTGSYGLFGNSVTVQTGKENSSISLSYNHLDADGYRQHSQMARDNVNLVGSFAVSPKRTVSVVGLYSDLSYQTPGGLTAVQYRANPRQSRPATPTIAGAAEQRAGIYQKLGYLGFSHEFRWSERVQNTTVIYGSLTDFANPFITNYEKRPDQGLGGRTVTQVRMLEQVLPTTLTFGAEWQRNFTISRNYGNRRGQPDTLQNEDELRARQSVLFLQTETALPANFRLTLGLSRNDVRYGFTRFSVRPIVPQERAFAPVWLPRVALLRTLGSNVSIFASVSTGYSAPSGQEVRPSEATFNTTLEPERGINYEAGLRGQILNSRLQFDIALYQFELRQTIVRRSTATGAEFFVNAGRTDQKGLEALLSYDLAPRPALVGPAGFWRMARVWHSLTLANYRFRDSQRGGADVSGKRIPGVPSAVAVAGLDAETRLGFYGHVTYQFINQFPLNDPNTFQSDPARILTATAGFRRPLGQRWTVDAYVSGDNLLDQQYSLGYDLNAVGNRFYNASAKRNFVTGIRLAAKW